MRKLVKALLHALYRAKELLSDLTAGGPGPFPSSASYYPTGLGIEVTNLCNANCVFCGYQYRERPVSFMSQEIFQKVIDQYTKTGKANGVGLTPVVGDPLIDRDLVKKIKYIRSASPIRDIHITTNAILLNRPLFDELVDEGLNMLTVSLSGFDEKEYKRIYRNSSYQKVIANLRAISDSDRFKKCKSEIGLRTDSLFPWRKKEFWEFRARGFQITRTVFFDSWSGRIKDEDLPRFMFLRPQRKSKHVPCQMLYAGPLVLADGTLTACGCRDLEGNSELKLGHILENPMNEILESGKMEDLRRRFTEGDLPAICKDCSFYTPMSYSRHQTLSALPSPAH